MRAILFSFVLCILLTPISIAMTANEEFIRGNEDSAAIMIAGELWDSFLPPNAGSVYFEAGLPLRSTFLRMGNFDRKWSTPTHMWPGGWPYGMFWGKGMYLVEFNPDSTWNPPMVGGLPNPAYHIDAGGRYAFASFSPTVLGAADPTRNYIMTTRWLDSLKRQHLIYEAGWPTNIGIDVKMKIHQFTLNWNNFNDCIIVEIVLTNTGVIDLNGDGVPDSLQTGRPGHNQIHTLALMAHGEVYCSYYLDSQATRLTRFGAARGIGYIGDNNSTGSPWDMVVAFPGESSPGLRDLGFNDGVNKYYTDIWSAWAWIGVKNGSAQSESVRLLPENTTIYGTHPIGTGSQRGWYSTAGQGRGLARNGLGSGGSLNNPERVHTAAMGVWYADGGKSRDSLKLDLNPDPNFFTSGTAGDPTTFIPKAVPARPAGDRKLLSESGSGAFEIDPHESGWSKGFTGADNFDGDLFDGLGPFSLSVGESMTIVWAEAGGYRLQGVQNGIAAARWLFENGYALPGLPSVPQMTVEGTTNKTVRLRWDNHADNQPGFAGYKIWRASARKPVEWLRGGMRALDEYWRAQVPGTPPDTLLKSVNPDINLSTSVGLTGEAGSWGAYDLLAVIDKSMLSLYGDSHDPRYAYSWEDKGAQFGMRYWYYVSSFENGLYDLGTSYAGTNSRISNSLETSNLNRNGATGLWGGAYPFAESSFNFPKTFEDRLAIGAAYEVTTPSATSADLSSGSVKIGVKPNPYKRKALSDNPSDQTDHHVVFYNLPAQCAITIMDVSGQIIDRIQHQSPNQQNGTHSWNLFSKDGIEVASGLYVYLVEYEGGKQIGYLSILR